MRALRIVNPKCQCRVSNTKGKKEKCELPKRLPKDPIKVLIHYRSQKLSIPYN